MFDDGTGPALYAGGAFSTAGGMQAHRIAKWDGTSWHALGTGMTGFSYTSVRALTVFDDGTGPALFAAGEFMSAGGGPAQNVAKWDGSNWSPVGALNGQVNALAVFDDSAGPALYAGGDFGVAGSPHIAKLNGTSWLPAGGGVNGGSNVTVKCMTVFDDGSGAQLYVGGHFQNAGTKLVNNIAAWDGISWSSLGSGIIGNSTPVLAMHVFDDRTGPVLLVGGIFGLAGGLPASNLATWNGAAWSEFANGIDFDEVCGIGSIGGQDGCVLYVGGYFSFTGDGIYAPNLARWDGLSWSAVAEGNGLLNAATLAVFDDGNGPHLHTSAYFPVDEEIFYGVFRWMHSQWVNVGDPFNTGISVLESLEDGSGQALYAAGRFAKSPGVYVIKIFKWDGSQWSEVGDELWGVSGSVNVQAMTIFDDGTGPALYVGGHFVYADSWGGLVVNNITKWDGTQWSALAGGTNNPVYALEVFDDGNGPALYAAGHFTVAGDIRAARIARWDGKIWTPLGSGTDDSIRALCVHDDLSGSGPALYAGGYFKTAGDIEAHRIARWNGIEWSTVGAGVGNSGYVAVSTLAVHDDNGGEGKALYAGGNFTIIGGVGANAIAKWNGKIWSRLANGLYAYSIYSGSAGEIVSLENADEPGLYVIGGFTFAGAHPSYNIARWSYPTAPCIGDTSPAQGDGIVNINDLFAILTAWGPCPDCLVDTNNDDLINTDDLLAIINAWGDCP